MLPLRVMRRTEVRPYMTYAIIGVNVFIFMWQVFLPRPILNQMFFDMAVNACQITTQWWNPKTWLDMLRTTFLHGSYAHIAGNMIFLALFGPSVEEYFGRWRFLGFYLLGGFAAALTHGVVQGASSSLMCHVPLPIGPGFVPLIGASGAISAVMGAFILLHPGVKVRTLIPLIGPIGPAVNLPALVLLGYFFLIDFINGIMSITDMIGVSRQVAFWAHIGGFIFGAITIFLAIMWKPAPPQNIIED
jgi:membrane associated rhomboid family serine protease